VETDKRYFIAGLFIVVLTIGAALGFMLFAGSERRDDVLYTIRFKESVSGLLLGESVKYRGVDVGTVKSMALDAADPRIVQVGVMLRKDAPIKTDTMAVLKLKGVTGGVFIELNGGNPGAQPLLASTPAGQVPEIESEKSSLNNVLDQLPHLIEKFSALEDQAKNILKDTNEFTTKVKDNPSLLIWRQKKKDAAPPVDAVKDGSKRRR
jgi:phospholipid/cholesterol/gamma-HCH transport system substrate-binding protein